MHFRQTLFAMLATTVARLLATEVAWSTNHRHHMRVCGLVVRTQKRSERTQSAFAIEVGTFLAPYLIAGRAFREHGAMEGRIGTAFSAWAK